MRGNSVRRRRTWHSSGRTSRCVFNESRLNWNANEQLKDSAPCVECRLVSGVETQKDRDIVGVFGFKEKPTIHLFRFEFTFSDGVGKHGPCLGLSFPSYSHWSQELYLFYYSPVAASLAQCCP